MRIRMLKCSKNKENRPNSGIDAKDDQDSSASMEEMDEEPSDVAGETMDTSLNPQIDAQAIRQCEKSSNHISAEEEHFEQDDSSDQSRKSGGFLGQLGRQHHVKSTR